MEKKTIRVLAAVVAMVLLIPIVSAQESVFEVELTFHRNGSVELDDLRVRPGYPHESQDGGKYSIGLVSGEQTLTEVSRKIGFRLMSDPPVMMDRTQRTINLKYFEEAEELVVKSDGKELLRYNMAGKICNNNGICSGMETYLSCPGDCASYASDSVCNKASDGGCDPDCFASVDPDCFETTTTIEPTTTVVLCGNGVCDAGEDYSNCPGDCPKKDYTVYLVVGVLLIIVVGYVLMKKKG